MRRIGLTPRERQIAQLLATCPESYAELAKELGITVMTFKKHAGIVYEKLYVRGRVELVAYWRFGAFQKGIEAL